MAKLILTQAEKAAESYLDWDDAALGQLVRKMSANLRGAYGEESAIGAVGRIC